jgi:hypothetical protein
MSTEAAWYGRAANPMAGFAVDIEPLTRSRSGGSVHSTTPPTPLNDAHQGGYFFGRPSRYQIPSHLESIDSAIHVDAR